MSNLHWFAIEDSGPRPLPVPEEAAQFTDLYAGLALGVYTALRTFNHNHFLYLDRHLDRTEKSMSLLGWDYALDRSRLCRQLDAVVTTSTAPEMRVRLDVLAEPATQLGTNSRELIAIQPFTPPPAALYEQGVSVAFAEGLSRTNPLVKTAEFAARRPASTGLKQLEVTARSTTDDGPQTTAGGEAVIRGPSPAAPYEFLLTSPDGHILEGTGTNFWGVREGVVYTAGEGVLEGITRTIILQLLRELEIPVRLEAIHVSEVGALDEAALSGSSRAFLPVVEIAGQTIGDRRPGPLSRRILDVYNAFLATHLRRATEGLDTSR